MTSHRIERVADTIREILARVVREEIRDPQVGFVTLTDVKISPDLKHARVFVAAHGEAPARAASIDGLNRAAGFLRRSLAKEAGLRHTPGLLFVEDTAVERGSRVESILREIREEAPAAGPVDDSESEAGT